MNKSNLIDITKRIKENKRKKTAPTVEKLPKSHKAQVLTFADKLEQKVAGERRKVTRTVLSQLIGVFVLTSKRILQPVAINDISIDGLSFDMVQDVGSYDIGNTVTMRIYMSHDTYFTFNVKVTNKRLVEERGIFRHGVVFAKNQPDALYHFVRFLETVAQVAQKDKGEKLAGRVD